MFSKPLPPARPHLFLPLSSLFLSSFVLSSFLLSSLLLSSCSPTPAPPTQTSLYLYRFTPPAFVEFSPGLQALREIQFSIPPNCSLFDVFPAPSGSHLLIEMSCPNGQTVLFLDTGPGSVTQPVTGSDAHFLAWGQDGRSAYLKVDSLGEARVVRVSTGGKETDLGITGWAYDLSPRPGSDELIFSFSRGLGAGSELHLIEGGGQESRQLVEDPFHYISFARYSPDGSRIAFIKIPDSQTPFTVGELWVVDADGSHPRKLADADAGHGYAANWSPDGAWIAFVRRENARDQSADQSPESLISNIYLVNVQSGALRQITFLTTGRAETPHWSPDGNMLGFNTVIDGRIEVQIADITTGESRSLTPEPACCPGWMRK